MTKDSRIISNPSASSNATVAAGQTISTERRNFLGAVGGAALLSATSFPAVAAGEDKSSASVTEGLSSDEAFRERAFRLRVAAAQTGRDAPVLPASDQR